MKILILKNKGVKEKFVKKEVAGLKYFNEIDKNFGLNNIPYTVDEVDIDFEVEISPKGSATDGQVGHTLNSIPNIPQGYDFVAIFYDGVPVFKSKAGNFAYSRKEPINGAYICEIPDSSNKNVLIHELMHLIGYKLTSLGFGVSDQMDITLVDGEWKVYHLNKKPKAKEGNYHTTLKSYSPFVHLISQRPETEKAEIKRLTTIVDLLKQVLGLQKQLNEIKAKDISKDYKFFYVEKKYMDRITQTYLNYDPYKYLVTGYHIGVDYGTPKMTPVYAPVDGKIVEVRNGYYGGLTVFYAFSHAGKDYTMRFMHLEEAEDVQDCKAGDLIAYTGNTGALTTGSHLHVDCWKGEVQIEKIKDKASIQEYTVDPDLLIREIVLG